MKKIEGYKVGMAARKERFAALLALEAEKTTKKSKPKKKSTLE